MKNECIECPNCNKVMKAISHFIYTEYQCSDCEIAYETYNHSWKVPIKYSPTEKQKNTLLFINSRLGTNFRSITKRQCSKIISDNFEKAKATPKKRPSYYTSYGTHNFTDEDCDMLGLDASWFY